MEKEEFDKNFRAGQTLLQGVTSLFESQGYTTGLIMSIYAGHVGALLKSLSDEEHPLHEVNSTFMELLQAAQED